MLHAKMIEEKEGPEYLISKDEEVHVQRFCNKYFFLIFTFDGVISIPDKMAGSPIALLAELSSPQR